MHKMRLMPCGLLLLMMLAIPTSGWAGEANLDASLRPLVAKNITAQALLLLKNKGDGDQLSKAVELLQQKLKEAPTDRSARLFYGYGQLLLAGDFMLKKNYMRAAELSKQGFYALDEAAEQVPENWRLRYLRARMDAFVPAKNGRCVVAMKDLASLTGHSAVPASLTPMLLLMQARAEQSCRQPEKARQAWQKLREMGPREAMLTAWRTGAAPAWSASEINDVLLPLLAPRS